MEILLVEDQGDMRKFFESILDELGHSVSSARSGYEAADAIEETPRFDAVITDVQMPNGDGMFVLQHMSRMSSTPPTLVHSSDTLYIKMGDSFELSKIPEIFRFATFVQKRMGDSEYTKEYFQEFLETCAQA